MFFYKSANFYDFSISLSISQVFNVFRVCGHAGFCTVKKIPREQLSNQNRVKLFQEATLFKVIQEKPWGGGGGDSMIKVNLLRQKIWRVHQYTDFFLFQQRNIFLVSVPTKKSLLSDALTKRNVKVSRKVIKILFKSKKFPDVSVMHNLWQQLKIAYRISCLHPMT